MTETKRLGRGLEALIGPVSREQAEASGALRELPLSSVKPNPFQPRTRMDEAELKDLAASMEASSDLSTNMAMGRWMARVSWKMLSSMSRLGFSRSMTMTSGSISAIRLAIPPTSWTIVT